MILSRLAHRVAYAALLAFLPVTEAYPARAEQGPPYIRTQPQPTAPAVLLRRLQRSLTLEDAASRLALQRTRNARVRRLAQELEGHARIVRAGLRSLALQGVQLPAQTQLTPSDSQSLEQLRRLREPNFNARYLNAMRGIYEEMLQDLRSYQQNGSRGPVLNFATQINARAKRNYRDILRVQDSL